MVLEQVGSNMQKEQIYTQTLHFLWKWMENGPKTQGWKPKL